MFPIAGADTVVACSPEKAFAYAANLENFAAWFPGVISIDSDDELPFTAVGKHYRETVAVPLRGRREVRIKVVEVGASRRRLVTEGRLPLLLPRMEMEFLDAGPHACEVRWRMFSRNTRALPRWTVLPLARFVIRRRAESALRNLRQRLEGAAPPSGPDDAIRATDRREP
ncbi:SRPBCC family protein [Nocardia gipuzkoensis]|uniref:SRPBCC family protein n=1 Tax=Nocardia gipuzkoensis TaxID=2749991 RepID=UPI001E3C7586|nr:SRPBCC family protein [Nocardia gipuzkoensis]UGT66019.1 SRPBCC family protein [Nocardia gipuzkoensis]